VRRQKVDPKDMVSVWHKLLHCIEPIAVDVTRFWITVTTS